MRPLLLLLLVLVACRDAEAPTPPRASADAYHASAPRVVDETEDTRRLLVTALLGQGIAREAIIVSESAGALATTRLWASVEGETTARATAIIAGLRHFGARGRGLAELALERAWHTRPPPAAELAELVRFGWLPELSPDPDRPPVLATRPRHLTLTFQALRPDRVRVQVDMPAEGEATITLNDHIEEGGPPDLAVLRAAIGASDTRAILAALKQPLARTPERDALLATLAATPDPAIADAAAVLLGGGEEAVQAFARSWPTLDREARARIRSRAEDLYGDGFVTRLP